MGGYGSGSSPTYETTANYYLLNIGTLCRAGLFPDKHRIVQWGWGGKSYVQLNVNGDYIVVSYTAKGYKHAVNEQIRTETVVMSGVLAGRRRRYFCCPYCGRHASKLYIGTYKVACRKCFHLVYPTQRMHAIDRTRVMADRLYRKLGANPGDSFHEIQKPKGMHWRTFERKLDEIEEAVSVADACAVFHLAKAIPAIRKQLGIEDLFNG